MRAAQTHLPYPGKILVAGERSEAPPSPISTGVASLDIFLGGGLPRGQIVEIVGTLSSGKTGLLLSILSRAVSQGERVVYIDVFDSFDPTFAEARGMDLGNLLWVRCCDWPNKVRVDKALKAMDILARSEGFGILALDLVPTVFNGSEDGNQRIPFHVWFRLKRLIQGKQTTILLLSRNPCSGSAPAMVLGFDSPRSRWSFSSRLQERNSLQARGLFRGIRSEIRFLRGKRHGQVQVYSAF